MRVSVEELKNSVLLIYFISFFLFTVVTYLL